MIVLLHIIIFMRYFEVTDHLLLHVQGMILTITTFFVLSFNRFQPTLITYTSVYSKVSWSSGMYSSASWMVVDSENMHTSTKCRSKQTRNCTPTPFFH